MKKLFYLIIEPLKAFANRNFAEKLSTVYNKNKWMAYILAIVLTVVVLFLAYIIPNL